MKEKIKRWIERYFDYEITGEYYDSWQDKNGAWHFKKKYNKRYFLKCLKR